MNAQSLADALQPLVGRWITFLQDGQRYGYLVRAVCVLPEDARVHPGYDVMIQRTPANGFVLPAARVVAVAPGGGGYDIFTNAGQVLRIGVAGVDIDGERAYNKGS